MKIMISQKANQFYLQQKIL